ncbi:MAG: hypothetical protein ABI707_10500, partial [Ferruginibacter sp.]
MKKFAPVIVIFLLAENGIAQNVGIGTITPKASFNIAAGKTVLFGADTSGQGSKLIWYPTKSAFRAGILYTNHFIPISSTEWDYDNIGTGSFAAGENNLASGNYSAALGAFNTASSDYAIAIGNFCRASGYGSIATGNSSNASGYFSTSMGRFTIAKSGYETVVGALNTDYNPLSENGWNDMDRLFTIGNGTSSTLRSDALVVLKNGNTGIGISKPRAVFNVAEGKTVLFGADTTSPGSKLIWYPSKSAFRAGGNALDYWNYQYTGQYSIATGFATMAYGVGSSAFGGGSFAVGKYATAMGEGTHADGDVSVAMGEGTDAESYAETVIGSYDTDYQPESAIDWAENDRLFTIGNGQQYNKRDALVVLKNGNTGIGTSTPDAKLT